MLSEFRQIRFLDDKKRKKRSFEGIGIKFVFLFFEKI